MPIRQHRVDLNGGVLGAMLVLLLSVHTFSAQSQRADGDPTASCPFSPVSGVCINDHRGRVAQLEGVATPMACCNACGARSECTGYTHFNQTRCNLFSGTGRHPTTTMPSCSSGLAAPSPPNPSPGPPTPPAPPGAKNVLYFVVDDLRTGIGYNDPAGPLSPNLDKLVASGTYFPHAYVQQAVCAPSRNSFMSGRRPDSIQVWNFIDTFRSAPGGKYWIPMPEHFKKSGWITLGGGKTYHPNRPTNWDEPYSWSQDRPYFPFAEPGCPDPEGGGNVYTHSFCLPDGLTVEGTYDYALANHTIDSLRYVASTDRPWFVMAGFRRPHLPWRLPQAIWDMYDDRTVKPAAVPNMYTGMPEIAFTCGDRCSWETWNISNPSGATPSENFTMATPVSDTMAVSLRRAYFAALTLMDSQVGRVLDELDTLGLRNDTIVVFHGDHGWGLGEGNLWHKFTNFEHTARTPLVVRAPWIVGSAGQVATQLVELVDLYPTLARLSGSPTPANASALDGTDFTPALGRRVHPFKASPPSLAGGTAWPGKSHAFSQFPRCGEGDLPSPPTPWPTAAFGANYCKGTRREAIFAMGYSVRDAQFRYTRWHRWNGSALAADWTPSGFLAEELYNHTGDNGSDFDAFPIGHANLADTGGAATTELQALRKVAEDFFRWRNYSQ